MEGKKWALKIDCRRAKSKLSIGLFAIIFILNPWRLMGSEASNSPAAKRGILTPIYQ